LGGRILYGIENGEHEPPAGQRIKLELLDTLRKRIGERTVNVIALPRIVIAASGGEYIELTVQRSTGVASTTDGRYYLRIADDCKPVVGDEVMRLANERSMLSWETLVGLQVPRSRVGKDKLNRFCADIRNSDRVKTSVKEKSSTELLDHYLFASGTHLTNLGILCVGRREDRARLGTAPIIQVLKYDELGQRVNKLVWDDHVLAPMELVDAVWREVPDFRESYEIPEGLYRSKVPAFDESVVRELLVNALVHRPYTQQGDIFLNLHPDRLEIVNPGLLPLGVTPRNILHQSRRRNDGLARVFHDLGLMEREGSGYDMMYDRLLSMGRSVPQPVEKHDAVQVTIQRRIIRPQVIRLLEEADQRFQLSQRERITLGLLAQSEGMRARELAATLELDTVSDLQPWIGRLRDFKLVRVSGRTQGARYFVDPVVLKSAGVATRTSLTLIEQYRIDALVREDIRCHPGARIGEINARIGKEINRSQVKRALAQLKRDGEITMQGQRGGARYWLCSPG
jgi:ATP-dependent DNA helicase RecG